jgi:hypothetical protein
MVLLLDEGVAAAPRPDAKQEPRAHRPLASPAVLATDRAPPPSVLGAALASRRATVMSRPRRSSPLRRALGAALLLLLLTGRAAAQPETS